MIGRIYTYYLFWLILSKKCMMSLTFLKFLQPYLQLYRLEKPIGIFLLLCPTICGVACAFLDATTSISPSLDLLKKVLLLFTLGVILMRSSGCGVNDFFDVDFDKHVARTKSRPFALGLLTKKQVLWAIFIPIIISCSLLLYAIIVWGFSWQLVLWAIVALFLAMTYPLLKRFFPLPQAYLAICFSISIPMSYVAFGLNPFNYTVGLLILGNALWTIGYDTFYAMTDKIDDEKLSLHSSAKTFGRYDGLIAGCCYAVGVILLVQTLLHVNNILNNILIIFASLNYITLLYLYFHYRKYKQPFLIFKKSIWICIFLMLMAGTAVLFRF
jgi:4-hydroxybenzoate polyprenyltransferase